MAQAHRLYHERRPHLRSAVLRDGRLYAPRGVLRCRTTAQRGDAARRLAGDLGPLQELCGTPFMRMTASRHNPAVNTLLAAPCRIEEACKCLDTCDCHSTEDP